MVLVNIILPEERYFYALSCTCDKEENQNPHEKLSFRYIPTLFRFPAFKKSQYEQSEKDWHVIISEKEKHKININQMWEILTVTKIPFKVLYLFL